MVTPTLDLPYAFGGPAGEGRLRTEPEDFIVRELPVCEPDGAGEHVWLWVRKRDANTDWVARQLARFAGVAPRDVSYAGLKDRRAVTEQWFSIQLPGRDGPDWSSLRIEGAEILRAERHSRKLRRGALRGNAFAIRIRELHGDRALIEQRLSEVARRGVPNYFGEQRFGREGANLAGAEALFLGERRRLDRHLRGLYLSAARSHLFNLVLAARVDRGDWDQAIPGDLLQPNASHGWFRWDAADPSLPLRLQGLEVHPTGPLWGRGELPTTDVARELEVTALAGHADWRSGLERAGLEQERRALRLQVDELAWQWDEVASLTLRFALTSGGYATSVLREVVRPLHLESDDDPS